MYSEFSICILRIICEFDCLGTVSLDNGIVSQEIRKMELFPKGYV